jgi:hypothetical protein
MAEARESQGRGFFLVIAVAAITALGVASFALGGRGGTSEPSGPTVVFASTDVNCKGGGTFSISTGTDGGSCSVNTDASGNVTGGSCGDGGNKSGVNCGRNSGSGACDGTSGKGGCQSK